MAVQRLTAANIETAVLEIMGYSASTTAPWGSAANFYVRMNEYAQRLPFRLNMLARQMGIKTPIHFECWKSSCNSSTSGTTVVKVTAATATIYLPSDYDHYISFWDITDKHKIPVIKDVDKYHSDLANAVAGPTQAVEISGFVLDGSDWRRSATLYPTPTGTPSIRLQYYRLPAIMDAAGEYPDIDPKYESLFIYGTVCDLARNTAFEYDRYAALEKEMMADMISTARSV